MALTLFGMGYVRSGTDSNRISRSQGGANGVILAQTGSLRWLEPLFERRQADIHLQLGLKQYTIAGGQALPTGKATIRYEFVYDGGGVGKGGTGTLYVNGKNVATGRIDQTQWCAFSADEGADEGTPVTEDYQVPFKFTGKIDKVTIRLKEMTQSAAIETGKARQEAILKRALSDQAQRPRTDAGCLLPIFQNAQP
jgi:arylsulfatase